MIDKMFSSLCKHFTIEALFAFYRAHWLSNQVLYLLPSTDSHGIFIGRHPLTALTAQF